MTSEPQGMQRALSAPARFWSQDASLTAMLAFLVSTIFILGPLAPVLGNARLLVDLGFLLALLLGVFAVSPSRWAAWPIAGLVACGQVFHWLLPPSPSRDLAALDAGWMLLVVALLALLVLRQVLREGVVTFHRIRGSIAVYLLLGFLFALVYQILELERPGAMRLSRPVSSPSELLNELFYFSFTTLTTVGWGDVTAVHPAARSAAVLEALAGQLFPAILIARLVSLHLADRAERRPPPG